MTPSDEPTGSQGEPTPEVPASPARAPARPLHQRIMSHQLFTPVAALVAALAVGFGGGFVTGKSNLFTGHRVGGSTAVAEQGQPWSLFGHPRDASAPRRGIPKPDGFVFWRQRVDTSGGEPLACLELTKPLDPAKSYSDYVLVTPDLGHPAAVRVKNNTELCVAGLGFNDRHITLLKGLPGKDGGVALTENADVDFTFGEKPPYVGFAGDGVILPREDSDGVGIETINVSKLQIEVWRVADRNLVRKSISSPDPTGEGEYADDYGDDSPRDEGRVVWKGEISVRGENGQKTTTVFPLGAVLKEMKAGGYVIKAKDASGGRDLAKDEDGGDNQPAQARRWVMFTDMALIGYTGADSLDVVVRSLKSAKTLSGLRVALVAKNGEDLAEATTDSNGRVRFLKPLLEGEGAGAAKMVMAYGPQGDLAVLDLDRSPIDLSKQGTGGRTPGGGVVGDDSATGGRAVGTDLDGFLYADRGIFRPGETAHITALLRDLQSHSVKDRKGSVVISRPSGVEFKRFAFAEAPLGAITTDVALPKSAPRGRWTAKLMIEGVEAPVGEMSFQVEDFAPQRLAVTIDGNKDNPVAAGETRQVAVNARFLYGAPGSGLQTQGEARLSADSNPFPAYKDYQWGDDKTPFEEKALDLASTVTDGEGKATLAIDSAQAGDTAVPLKATLTASVFEPGGRPVRESLSIKVRPKGMYLGVKVDQGEAGKGDPPIALNIIAVNAAGARVNAAGVSYTLISENWNYDWFLQDGKWQYRRSSRDGVVQKGVLNVGTGDAARIARKLGWGDYRLELEGPDGAKSIIRFTSGWGSPAKESDTPDFVRLSAGATAYAQGDTIELTLKAPYAGQAQIAVATDRLVDFKTMAVDEKGGVIRLKTNAAWGGGAYILVTVIQPRDPVSSPKPRRALGLLYVSLDPKSRKLSVDIGTPVKLDSKAPVTVPIQVKGLGIGQTARVTVAAVDEGILRLTKQESPDPVKWYFGKRALTLDYRDDYGRLLDPNLGPAANVNFGADEIGGEGLTVTPIKSVALWSGVVETGMDGKATIKLPAADFNGELRIMAVAWTDEAVGSGSKPMTVRQPVVADLNLPRFLSPGDKPFATLELHNVEGKPGAYTAIANATNGIKVVFNKVFNLLLGQRVAEKIPFEAPGVTGVGQVSFNVTGQGFNTSKTYDIQTRLGWGPITRTTTDLQRPGESFTPSADLLAGMAAGDISLQVSYSPFKGFDPGPIALALNRYPYGCTEQLVSTAYPLLYALEVSNDPKLRRSSVGLNDAVGKLLDRQTLDGAFGLWRVGDGEADAWLGAFATDFLLEAKMRGAPVPDEAIDRALNAMRQISRPEGFVSVGYRTEYPAWWAGSEDNSKAATARLRSRASAYALYVLAKGGRGDLARLRWWHDVQMKNEASPLAKGQVGAGLAMMGDKARARDSFRQAIASIGFDDKSDWYQSRLRDLAAIIALAYESGMDDIARPLQDRLDGAVRDPDSLNTQEQARLLQAAHYMLKAAGPMTINATGNVYAIGGAAGMPRWGVGRLTDSHFANAGRGALWRTVTVRGTPLVAPPPTTSGLSVSKRLFSFSGGPVDIANLKQGDRVIVLVQGRSMQGQSLALVVDDPLPAGFEIETVLGPDDAENGPFKFLGKLSGADVQESRDDRYVAAMDLPGNEGFAFAYVARAVTPGDFFLPGATARDMYHPGIWGSSAAGRTSILPGM